MLEKPRKDNTPDYLTKDTLRAFDLLSSSKLGRLVAELEFFSQPLRGQRQDLLQVVHELPEEQRRAVAKGFQAITDVFAVGEDMLAVYRGLVFFKEQRQSAAEVAQNSYQFPRRQPEPLRREDILVVYKDSKLEWDSRHWGLDFARTLAQYKPERREEILLSHRSQVAMRQCFKVQFPESNVIAREDASEDLFAKYGAVLALGGDNHAQEMAHMLPLDKILIPVNIDSKRSVGGGLTLRAEEFLRLLPRIEAGEYALEAWPRLEAVVDGKPLVASICDYHFGERDNDQMSRHTLERNGEKFTQKSSGLLVGTGLASTSWSRSASRWLTRHWEFPRTAPLARFIQREIYLPPGADMAEEKEAIENASGWLQMGEKLVIHSLNDSEGVISSDSLDRYPFPYGARAEISLSNTPLWALLSG